MKRLLLLAVLAVTGTIFACSVATPPRSQAVAEALRTSVSLELKQDQFGKDLAKSRAFCAGTVVRVGVVLTNRHCVVSVSGRDIWVRYYDGRLVKATVLYVAEDGAQSLPEIDDADTPRATDAALLAVDPVSTRDIATVADVPDVGEPVFAIGSPKGLAFTVTFGSVSFKLRDLGELEYGPNLWIQHDAPLSSGNSGGGLFDAHGRLVGINTLRGNGANLGLAVPIGHVLALFKDHL